MKTLVLPSQVEIGDGGPRFWKSLEEWSRSPEFLPYLHREFPEHASEWDNTMSRRRFLRLMGASLALAGLTACSRQPQQKLVPYVRRPEEIIPGKSIFYATTFPHRGYGKGVLARTEMGRPTKIEGNPDHPASLGATDVFMQASILGLYDPDRSQTIRRGDGISNWDAFIQFAEARAQAHGQDQGAGLFLLTGRMTSPTFGDQLQRLQKRFPKFSWCSYEPAAPIRARSLSGKNAEPLYDLGKADIIVSLDADFLLEGPANLALTKAFSQRRRKPSADFNRLYVVESTPSITGIKADVRWRRKPSGIAGFAQELADAVLRGATAVSREATQLAAELGQHRGRSVIMAGDYQPEIVHALAFQLNQALGNIGVTVNYRESPGPAVPSVPLEDFVAALKQGAATTLLIAGVNPAYDLPPALDFAGAMARVANSIHLGLYEDETGSRCHWHLPEAHYLEAWGDILAMDGTPSLIQPVIEPLYPGAVSLLEVMSLFVDVPPLRSYDIVRHFWQRNLAAGTPNAWERSLNKGVVVRMLPLFAPVAVAGVMAAPSPAPVPASQLEISFRPDPSVDDGRFANNAWLQELPRPLSKLTWDNVAMLSPRDAATLGVTTGDVIHLVVSGRTVDAPAWVQPGHADGCVSVTLGYGRTRAGQVANGVGFNAGALRSSLGSWSEKVTDVRAAGGRHELASTQLHFTMEGRGLIQVETLAEYKIDPRKAQEDEPDPPAKDNLYTPYEYKNHAWAMSIDLNTCVGCNACIVACQSENNIPVVGKDQVNKGREMHWIRVDRYFEGAPDDPAMHFQPVTCMQCEDAPCEVVCPVGATVHTSEGLNDMVYNRCVGTRYCSNNCPYKVRRFNFLDYSDISHPTLALQKNPNVTVRSLGVMEKCTYCVQRIETVRIDAQKEMRAIRDGEIVTACQQACPADAIVFGDINDPDSRVSRLKALPRNYGLLADLNTHPRTTYLAKVTNPPSAAWTAMNTTSSTTLATVSENAPLLPPGITDDSISERITGIVTKRKIGLGWIGGFLIAFSFLMMFNFAIAVLFTYGVGIWGIQMPVAWGFAIVNFVWWVGIGHAGTFISAVLYLCHQEWRTSINRFTEAMTLFAVACAGTFPLLHLGRPWRFFYLFPYPNTMALWPQFRSPLIWDMFAVMTYAIVSIIFFSVGLLPDLATLRDRSPHRWQQIIFGLLALGWRGSGRQWSRYKMAYLIMAGLATPLVVSVHSIVSLDFAVGIVPGWHTTIMPFYFVAAALQSGFAMGLILIIPVRHFYHLKDIITGRHVANMAKLMLATGLVVGHGYFTDTFISWYSADPYEKFITANKFTGAYALGGWLLMVLDVGVVQLVWFKAVRESPVALFFIAILANIGLWLDHYILVEQSLHIDYLTSEWRFYQGTIWDYMMLFGSLGLFATLFMVFIRVFPMVAISEIRGLIHKKPGEVKEQGA